MFSFQNWTFQAKEVATHLAGEASLLRTKVCVPAEFDKNRTWASCPSVGEMVE